MLSHIYETSSQICNKSLVLLYNDDQWIDSFSLVDFCNFMWESSTFEQNPLFDDSWWFLYLRTIYSFFVAKTRMSDCPTMFRNFICHWPWRQMDRSRTSDSLITPRAPQRPEKRGSADATRCHQPGTLDDLGFIKKLGSKIIMTMDHHESHAGVKCLTTSTGAKFVAFPGLITPWNNLEMWDHPPKIWCI